MYQQPRKVLALQILLIIIGFVGFILGAAISGLGGSAAVGAIILNIIVLLALLVSFIVTVVLLIKRIRDKDSNHPFGLYLFNVLLSFLILAFFTFLYLVIMLAITTIVLPFI